MPPNSQDISFSWLLFISGLKLSDEYDESTTLVLVDCYLLVG